MEPVKVDKQAKDMLKAVEVVKAGVAKRVDVDDDIKVYKSGTIVRIDIKVGE